MQPAQPKGRGILKVTRHPKLGPVPNSPKEQLWHYTLNYPFQVAPRLAAVSCLIEQSFRPGQDYVNGSDIVLFNDARAVHTERAIAVTRTEEAPNPNAAGKRMAMVKYPCTVGFVPFGAKRKDGTLHPHAGTGFGVVSVVAWPLDDSDLVKEVQRKGRRAAQGSESYRYLEIHQFVYDGKTFKIVSQDKVGVQDFVPGWTFVTSGLANGIPDGDDILMPTAMEKPGQQSGSGIARWRRTAGAWRPDSYQPVTPNDLSIEPSLIRDIDGEFLFCGRGSRDSGHPMLVWRSSEHGTRWELVVFVGGISSSPVSLNQAADGTPFIAANRYQYQTHMKGMASVPYFRLPNGMPRPDGGTRETMLLWPINDDRNAVEIPVIARDCLAELGPPPHGTLWSVDHPVGARVQLADGKWHSLLGYRLFEKEENTEFTAATEFTGAYLEEVMSIGTPIPVWNF